MVLIISDHPSTLIIYGNFKNDTCTAIIGANVYPIIVLIKVPCPENIPCPYYKFKKRHLNRKFCAAIFHCLAY